jgi:hypothetical protein
MLSFPDFWDYFNNRLLGNYHTLTEEVQHINGMSCQQESSDANILEQFPAQFLVVLEIMTSNGLKKYLGHFHMKQTKYTENLLKISRKTWKRTDFVKE